MKHLFRFAAIFCLIQWYSNPKALAYPFAYFVSGERGLGLLDLAGFDVIEKYPTPISLFGMGPMEYGWGARIHSMDLSADGNLLRIKLHYLEPIYSVEYFDLKRHMYLWGQQVDPIDFKKMETPSNDSIQMMDHSIEAHVESKHPQRIQFDDSIPSRLVHAQDQKKSYLILKPLNRDDDLKSWCLVELDLSGHQVKPTRVINQKNSGLAIRMLILAPTIPNLKEWIREPLELPVKSESTQALRIKLAVLFPPKLKLGPGLDNFETPSAQKDLTPSKTSLTGIESLADDILTHAFTYLDEQDRAALAQTCKSVRVSHYSIHSHEEWIEKLATLPQKKTPSLLLFLLRNQNPYTLHLAADSYENGTRGVKKSEEKAKAYTARINPIPPKGPT